MHKICVLYISLEKNKSKITFPMETIIKDEAGVRPQKVYPADKQDNGKGNYFNVDIMIKNSYF